MQQMITKAVLKVLEAPKQATDTPPEHICENEPVAFVSEAAEFSQ